MKTQLLCTFTKRNHFNETIDIIIACNDIVFNKIYVFSNEKDPHQLICTYKKNTNTLYTINALNDLIRELNDGKLDKRFPIDWENYKNCLLLTNENGLNKIPTRIYTIVDVTTWDKTEK